LFSRRITPEFVERGYQVLAPLGLHLLRGDTPQLKVFSRFALHVTRSLLQLNETGPSFHIE